MLLAVKSFETFPKHRYSFISEIFALNWYIFVALKNKKLLFPLSCRLKQNFLPDIEKLIEYFASTVIVLSFYLRVGPSPRTNMYFFLLSICIDELLSTPKITTFLPQSKLGSEKSEQELNPKQFLSSKQTIF